MNRQMNMPGVGSPIDLAPFGDLKYYYGDEPTKMEFVDAKTQSGSVLPSKPDAEGRRHLGLQ